MKNRRFGAQLVSGLLLAVAALWLCACGQVIYKDPEYNYSGRPVPPSGLLQRVLAGFTTNGSSGGLEILDGLRDIRSNVQNTIPGFTIGGFSSAQPIQILSFPEQTSGYVLSYTDGNLIDVNYSTEKGSGNVASFGAYPRSAAASPDGSRAAGASEVNGILYVSGGGVNLPLNLPNVFQVAMNRGNTVILAMVRNSNTLYRVVKLNTTMTPVIPPGAVDCEPLVLPVYCVVPVGGTYDHPYAAVFSADGNSVYVLNCGPECGGTTAGVTVLQEGALTVDTIPSVNPLAANAPSPMQTLPVANPVPIPGGATMAVSNGSTLYLSGQSVFSPGSNGVLGTTPRADGLLSGYLTPLNLTTYVASTPISISDGTHSKMLFADDNTLWVGAQQCANGERASVAAAQLASTGVTTQAGNFNCLTRSAMAPVTSFTVSGNVATFTAGNSFTAGQTVTFSGFTTGTYLNTLSGSVLASGLSNTQFSVAFTHANVGATNDSGTAIGAQIIPSVVQSTSTTTAPVQVGYPNTNQNYFYYGSLTGLCWVQTFHKVYTAYGGQIHVFNTADGSEIDNTNVTIQGTVLDVAYMDALTNEAN